MQKEQYANMSYIDYILQNQNVRIEFCYTDYAGHFSLT